MGRELQKKKNKSSISKVRQKPKSKKKILTNPIIAANWNQKETLVQNYRRLGLAARLNGPTGGIEKSASTLPADTDAATRPEDARDSLAINSKAPTKIDVSEAKIERDARTGRILRVLDGPTVKPNPLHDLLNDVDTDSSDDEDGDREREKKRHWARLANQHGSVDALPPQTAATTAGQTPVVRQLLAQASLGEQRRVRKPSAREAQWLEDLAAKYGDDYAKMSRDMRLNPLQQSEGAIRKRMERWRSSDGAAVA
ncbi:hypothetical protein LTR66_008143 [Elasticomyces elasticus]|nr:hypothetical protein LTR66_008143 [Elasticomyces elasticus]